MKSAKPLYNYLKFDQFSPRERVELNTNDSIKDEIFAFLEYLSEVEEVGKDLIRALGYSKDIDKTYLLFKSFIRQSKTFYISAESLHYRASPLNYYYSFLNMVKAYVALHDPDYVEKRTDHGLKHPFSNTLFTEQLLVAYNSDNSIFGKLYTLLTDTVLPKKIEIRTLDLFAYCTDIAYEFEKLGYGCHKNACVKFILGINKNYTSAHVLLAMARYQAFDGFESALDNFNSYFTEVDFHSSISFSPLKISAYEKEHYRFFESNRDYIINDGKIEKEMVTKDIVRSLKGLYVSNPYKDELDFLMASPLYPDKGSLFNEILAIYSAMFYLCSLVRYYPWYLEKILSGKDAWIIERFTKCAPTTFLRHLVSLIHEKDLIFVKR